MKTLMVDLGDRRYPIIVGAEILHRAGRLLLQAGFVSPPIVVTNSAVLRLHGAALLRSLDSTFGQPRIIRIGDGEQFKSHATLMRIYDGLFRAKADRKSWVLAFGGGVVGDISGFAAATFMRGIPYASVPTTLLGQVDSSIGGKVGINVVQGKNLIGAFHQPAAVLSDTTLLATLPRRELAAGLYEVIKCGAIRSEPLLGYLERRLPDILSCRPASLEHIVVESSRIKAEVVSGDEREEELRMVLNYGHTVGHALEAATGYRRFRHGEAVGWGMIAAVRFGREVGLMTDAEAERLVTLIQRVGTLPSLAGIDLAEVWAALRRDKKFRDGKIRMVLLPRLGATELRGDIDPVHLKRFLGEFLVQTAARGKVRNGSSHG
jgi:3-dehydroquinate synthase